MEKLPRNKKGQFIKGISYSRGTQFSNGNNVGVKNVNFIINKPKINCIECNVLFEVSPWMINPKRGEKLIKKYCSKKCANFGQLKIRPIISFWLGKENPSKGKKRPHVSGGNNHNWIKDRNLLKDDHKDRGGQLHREWSKSVKNRDGWKCKVSNGGCSGQVVAHHILPWRDYEDLRYEVNNGITLCYFHHPRKRNDEISLVPVFQQMVLNKA